MSGNAENVTQQVLTAIVNQLRLKRFTVRDLTNEQFALAFLQPRIDRAAKFSRIDAIVVPKSGYRLVERSTQLQTTGQREARIGTITALYDG